MAAEVQPQTNNSLPWHVWIALAIVALLRSLPFLATRICAAESGYVYPPVGYNLTDFMQYVALIRETTVGCLTLANPFTTMPQDGRFILLFHTLLGHIHALTGADPFWLLELSRIPCLAFFAWALWRFLTPVLPDHRHRVWACWLVALSGGVEYLVLWPCEALAERGMLTPLWGRIQHDLWHLHGWSTFESANNPLWLVGLALTLIVLRPLLQPGGPKGLRDGLEVGVGFVLLFFIHPYSALAVLAVTAMLFLMRAVFRDGQWRDSLGRTALFLTPALAFVGAVCVWQARDLCFKQSSAGALGLRELSVFWYPAGYGALLIFAALGWRQMIAEAHPWRLALGAWTLALALLHSSPVLNGYKFLFHLHIPICIAAAPAVANTIDGLRRTHFVRAALIVVALFASSAVVTVHCVRETLRHPVSADWIRAIDLLGKEPPGNVLAEADLGNLIPAYTPDRVYVGQWFLTPDYGAKMEAIEKMVKMLVTDPSPERASELRAFLNANRIRYVVFPSYPAEAAQTLLGADVEKAIDAGTMKILVVRSN